MIGGIDEFGEIFGSVPEGDISWNTRVAKSAIRAGYGVVLVFPGDKVTACTLTSAQAQKADLEAQDAAKETGNLGWAKVKHACGVAHVITDEKDLNKVGAKRLLADGANIAIAPGTGTNRLAVADLDTSKQVESFRALWKLHSDGSTDIGLTVSSPGVFRGTGDEGSWVHKDGGHVWFTVPDGVELPERKGRFSWCECHSFRPFIPNPDDSGKLITCPNAFALYWGSGYVLTPPSVRPEGPYRCVGAAVALPEWLADMAGQSVQGNRPEGSDGVLGRFEDDPIDVWAQDVSWSEILTGDGFTPAGYDNCGCPTFTRPGDATHSKSVTAHESGCSLNWPDVSSGHLPMHIWSDALGGGRTMSKLSWIAESRFGGNVREAMEVLGIKRMRDLPDLGFEYEPPTSETNDGEKSDDDVPEWVRELRNVPEKLRDAVTTRASETYISRRASRIVDLRIAAETGYAVDWDSRAVNGADWLSTDAPEIDPLWGTAETPLWVSGESLMFAGPPGVGKSTLAQMLVWGSLGLVPDVLGYPVSVVNDDEGILYLAMDRPEQIKRAMGRFIRRAFPERADEIIATASKRLTVWEGPLPGDITTDKRLLVNMAERYGRTRIIVDSIKDPLPNASDEARAGGYNTARQEALANGIEWIEIHHNRKANGDNKEPNKLDDVYGSTWLTSGAGSVFSLFGQPGETVLNLKHLKTPGEPLNPMWVELHRTTGLVTVQEQLTPEIVVASYGKDGATAEAVAMKLGGIVPGLKLPEGTKRSMVQNARNKLNRLVELRRVEKFEGPDGITCYRSAGAGLALDGGNS